MMRLPALGALLALLPMLAAAQSVEKNPFQSEKDIAEGRRMYRFHCVNCHGMDGASGRGARLATKHRRNGSSDREMFRTIANGIPGSEMPGQWLDEESVWKILAFVRTLEATAVEACPSTPGDAARGRTLFRGKGGCVSCHTIGLEGGRLGPDLTRAGANLSRQHLRESLLEPDKAVSGQYRTVQVMTVRGAKHEGIILNEDEYTLHMMDRQEQIRSFRKTELAKIERSSRSSMPGYGTALKPAELDDLLSYLCTLRGQTENQTE